MSLLHKQVFVNKWTLFTAKTNIVMEWIEFTMGYMQNYKSVDGSEPGVFDVIYDFAHCKVNCWEEFVAFTYEYDDNLNPIPMELRGKPPVLPKGELPNGMTDKDINDLAKQVAKDAYKREVACAVKQIEHAQKYGLLWEVIWSAYMGESDKLINLNIRLDRGSYEWDVVAP
jgi:hypothetical protein